MAPFQFFVFLLLGISLTNAQIQLDVREFNPSTMTTFGNMTQLEDFGLQMTTKELYKAHNAYYPNFLPFYKDGVHLSFTSHFSFTTGDCSSLCADGITFLMAQSKAQGVQGMNLGVPSTTTIVFVEFDTYKNPEFNDPATDHIGIGLSGNLKSVVTQTVAAATSNAKTTFKQAPIWYSWVDYDGPSMLLQVRLSLNSTKPANANIQYPVNIRSIIGQDTMAFGFGASTGGEYQIFTLLAWDLVIEGVPAVNYGFTQTWMKPFGNATLSSTATLTLNSSTELAGSVSTRIPFTFAHSGTALDFTITSTIIIDQPSTPGDGMTIIMSSAQQNYPRSSSSLGYEFLTSSVAVEFDTYQNTEYSDPDSNHVGINVNGAMTSVVTGNPGQLTNGGKKYVWIDYTSATQLLEVRVATTSIKPPVATVLTTSINFRSTIGSDAMYIGLGASTGSATERHRVTSLGLTINHCSSSPCLNGGTCLNVFNGHLCSCPGYWVGPTCSDVLKCPAEISHNGNFTATIVGNLAVVSCMIGYTGLLSRECHRVGDTAVWQDPTGVCGDVLCPSDTTGNAQYDQTRAGNTQTGVCQGGTYGSPTRRCVQMEGHNSEWQTPAGTCSNIYCAGITLNNATFPDTASGESKYGNCIANYRGSPLRDCLHNGTNGVWTAESGGSGCVPITCDAHEGVSGIFPSIQSGTTVIGTCPAGYGGTPNATCSQSGDVGIWGAVTSPCQDVDECEGVNGCVPENSTCTNTVGSYTCSCNSGFTGDGISACVPDCPAIIVENASFVTTPLGYTRSGTCLEHFSGAPKLNCTQNEDDIGEWSVVWGDKCVPVMCPAQSTASGIFEATQTGETVNGTCQDGSIGTPRATCFRSGTTGVWGGVQDPCEAQLLDSTTWISFIAYGIFGLVVFIIFGISRYKAPQAKNTLILFAGLSIIECATDSVFLWTTYRLPDKTIFYSSVFFTFFPMLLNLVLVALVFHREIKRQHGKGSWLLQHSIVATGVALLSTTNVSLLRLLDSKILNLESFSMDWNEETHLKGKVFGLVSDLLDNIPQVIIQGFYISGFGANAVGIASLIATSLSLLFGIAHKLLLLMVLRLDPPKSKILVSESQMSDAPYSRL